MKKIFLSAAFMLALSTVSSAALVQVFCGSANSANGSTAGAANGNGGYGSGTITCGNFNIGLGSTLNAVYIDAVMTYDGNFTSVVTNANVAIAANVPFGFALGGNASMNITAALSGTGPNFNIISL